MKGRSVKGVEKGRARSSRLKGKSVKVSRTTRRKERVFTVGRRERGARCRAGKECKGLSRTPRNTERISVSYGQMGRGNAECISSRESDSLNYQSRIPRECSQHSPVRKGMLK